MTGIETDYDTETLHSYLSAELGVEVVGSEVVHEALNLTIVISTEQSERAFVLRRPYKLRHVGYINDLEREYHVMERLEATPVPTPVPMVFCEDEAIIGDQFFVMLYLEGDAVPLGSDLPERFQNEQSRAVVAIELVDTLAAIHSLEVEPFEGICRRQTPREQVAANLERLDQAMDVTGHEPPGIRATGAWLLENAPSNPGTTLVHGDFRPGNVLFATAGEPEITGVLDWETATVGDPLTDLGYLLLRWRDDDDPALSFDDLEARYPNSDALTQLEVQNEDGLSPFTNRPGSPTRRELVARYERRTGRTFEDERFYRANAAFSLATVWMDFHRNRIEAGEASDWGPHIDYISMIADSIVSGEFEL